MATPLASSETRPLEAKRNGITSPLISDSIQKIIDAFPLPTVLLTQDEKVITVNANFLKLFSYPNKNHLIGKKPIEIFNCIYASDTIHYSRIADQCHNCGEHLEPKTSKVTCQKFTEKCNLTFVDENGHIDDLHNIKVSTSPFTIDGEQFYLFSITDISDEVRRRLLEKIFFHDALNMAGNIVGILDILKLVGNDGEESDALYESLKNTSEDLVHEINYQRDLSAAENNEITPVFFSTSSLGILHTTKNEIVNSNVARKREILFSSTAIDHKIITDGVLLRRVLLNMLKNALEATPSGGKVVLGCEPLDQDHFRFWVHNNTSIPKEIQMQLFNKSTSTKGCNRGLGTFSMRLFGEKYLKGKVHFISSEDTGTHFMIDLPLQPHEGE